MQYEINHLHLELSSLCNARCPFCPRTVQGYPANLGFVETNLSLADFKKAFVPPRLGRVHQTVINGNFGDFVMNPESIDIIRYLRRSRHTMDIRIHTNGSARDRDGLCIHAHYGGTFSPCCLERTKTAQIAANSVQSVQSQT
jgi:MoaA/NifB/PqqE/SkfB family radical SAM enzyme